MNLFIDKDSRFRGLAFKVGVFVVIGALASLALLFVLADRQGYFEAKSDLLTESPTGADLRPGMAVKLSGFKIGQVRRVSLNEQGRVDVLMRIEDRYLHWIRADSRASVSREGLIGDSYLSVTGGDPKFPALKDGDVLTFEQTPGLADIAQDLRARALPVIEGMTTLLDFLNQPEGDFRQSMANLRKLSGELRETRGRLDRLLDEVDAIAREDLRRSLVQLDASLSNLERQTTLLSERAGTSLAKLDEATGSARELADSARQRLDSASPRLERLIEDADSAVRESRRVIDGARRRWLFRGGEMPPPRNGEAGNDPGSRAVTED